MPERFQYLHNGFLMKTTFMKCFEFKNKTKENLLKMRMKKCEVKIFKMKTACWHNITNHLLPRAQTLKVFILLVEK
jgi:hypothetical protein